MECSPPAISVLSAVEGLHVATPALGHTVVPITIGLLAALFVVQFKGTSGIGIVFGSILLVWFIAIAVLGASQIEEHPEVLAAFNPIYGLDFLRHVAYRYAPNCRGADAGRDRQRGDVCRCRSFRHRAD